MSDFLSKLTGDLNKGIKNISSMGKELIETSKLKGEIKDVQDLAETKYSQLGKRVYEMYNKGGLNDVDIKSGCAEITLLFKRITELEAEIRGVEEQAIKERQGAEKTACPNCKAINNCEDKFCFSCGTPIQQESTLGSAVEGNNCKNCGNVLKEGAKFCMRCGAKTT